MCLGKPFSFAWGAWGVDFGNFFAWGFAWGGFAWGCDEGVSHLVYKFAIQDHMIYAPWNFFAEGTWVTCFMPFVV